MIIKHENRILKIFYKDKSIQEYFSDFRGKYQSIPARTAVFMLFKSNRYTTVLTREYCDGLDEKLRKGTFGTWGLRGAKGCTQVHKIKDCVVLHIDDTNRRAYIIAHRLLEEYTKVSSKTFYEKYKSPLLLPKIL